MRNALAPILWLIAVGLVIGLLARELSRGWFLPGLQATLLQELEQSLADQRELARLQPETAEERHRRFDRTQALVKRLRVLELSREGLARRHTAVLLVGALVVVAAVGGGHVLRQSRRDRRLARLQVALHDLARGALDVHVDDRGRDVIGRVAQMVEEVSTRHARDRRRLASLEDLSRWQEAARRHAHEMRTPLAAARLDVGRLRDGLASAADPAALDATLGTLDGDLRRLGEFAQAFADFGRLPPPRPVARDLVAEVREFADKFAHAWPGLAVIPGGTSAPCIARFDPELFRQVLVNLCENTSAALREGGCAQGEVRMTIERTTALATIDVADDGPGVPLEARERLFQPYATFRPGGIGLGLAISRKILLDHGGDLEWMPSPVGATFRLSLPTSGASDA
jgi:two-component system, NtrC family, nitrogen regulation sensor histidine kinase NtrY